MKGKLQNVYGKLPASESKRRDWEVQAQEDEYEEEQWQIRAERIKAELQEGFGDISVPKIKGNKAYDPI